MLHYKVYCIMFTAVDSLLHVNSIHANLQLHPVMWCCGMSTIEFPALCT